MLINGAALDVLSAADRGLHYGDGLFETLAVVQGRPRSWPRHMRRLVEGCRRLALPPPEIELLATEAASLCRGQARAVLKILVTRGPGGRGYRANAGAQATRILQLAAWPDYPASLSNDGVAITWCHTRLGRNPALAGIKHLNRLEQVLGRNELDLARYAEGLMRDSEGNVIEGTMTNLFLVADDGLVTSDLDQCGVCGIMRERVLEAAAGIGLAAAVRPVSAADVHDAAELFLTNSLIGIWPVKELDGRRYAVGSGTLARTLQVAIEDGD